MIIPRRMLCLKKRENIDLGELLLWKPYKNILLKFVELCMNKSAIEFDPISRVFDGLESAPEEIKHYYEAFLGVTSYYQHSKGGRGKYIEKKLATFTTTATLNLKLSELPLYLSNPELHKKKGIFTLAELSTEDKKKIRSNMWLWKGELDIDTDVANIIRGENTLVLMELKNRVDSGGTAGRREIWTKKFRQFLEILFSNNKIFEYNGKAYSLYELLKRFRITRVELYVGILFNVDGTPATKEGDRTRGFYSSNIEGFKDLLRYLERHTKDIQIIRLDEETPFIEIVYQDLTIAIGAVYGNKITQKLFHKDYPISELLLLRYDDIWLAQLRSIDERSFLLKYGKNVMKIFKELTMRDEKVRDLYNKFIESEGNVIYLRTLVDYLLAKYGEVFEDYLISKEIAKAQYLADIIYILAAAES